MHYEKFSLKISFWKNLFLNAFHTFHEFSFGNFILKILFGNYISKTLFFKFRKTCFVKFPELVIGNFEILRGCVKKFCDAESKSPTFLLRTPPSNFSLHLIKQLPEISFCDYFLKKKNSGIGYSISENKSASDRVLKEI